METNTCTITTHNGTCGQPAITSFIGSNGDTYYECADHAYIPADSRHVDSIKFGDKVTIRVHGVDKIGTVVSARRTRCDIAVPVYGGKRDRIVRNVPIADVKSA